MDGQSWGAGACDGKREKVGGFVGFTETNYKSLYKQCKVSTYAI